MQVEIVDRMPGWRRLHAMSRRERGLPVLGGGGGSTFVPSQAAGYFDEFIGDSATAAAWTSIFGTTSMVQAVGANQPTILTADINGHKAVAYNGTTQYQESSTWGMNGSANWTWYMVYCNLGTVPFGGVMYGSTGGGGTRVSFRLDQQDPGSLDNGFLRLERTGTNSIPNNGATWSVDTRPGGAGQGYHIAAGRHGPTANEFFVDGVSRGTWTNSDQLCYAFLTIGRYQAGILNTNFKTPHALNFNAFHNDTTMGQMTTYLRTRYALS